MSKMNSSNHICNGPIIAVIPAYNEAATIGAVIRETMSRVDRVIVVDDGSSDKTSKVAKENNAEVITLCRNMGVGAATRVGCDKAVEEGASIIITLDADGQHNPENIARMLTPLRQGKAKVVYGYRPRNNRMPLERKAGNILLAFIASKLFGSCIRDILTGFHAFTAECYSNIRWSRNGYSMCTEMACRTIYYGIRYSEVTVETIYHGKTTGMNRIHGIQALLLIIKWRLTGFPPAP